MTSPPPDKEPTIRLARQIAHENPYLRVLKDTVRFHTGREGTHWKVDYRRNGVGVVPLLPDGRVLLGLHYRYCPEVWGWEIAAGGMTEGEDPTETARRELEEETGYSSDYIEFLLTYHPAPGLGNETFHLYAAHHLNPAPDSFDAEEVYEVQAFSWAQVEQLMAEGELTDGFSVTGLSLARSRGLIA